MPPVPAPSPPACTAASQPPPPGRPPPPDRVEAPIDVWNPGGDPAVLRRAAQAWRQMAATLRASADEVESAVHQLGTTWEGAAHDAFARDWRPLPEPVRQGAETFEQVATSLEAVADQIEETNEQVHQLYAAIGITVAVGVVSSALTFGFGSAAAASTAAAQAGQAATIVARLGTFLTISARTMSGFRAAFVAFSQRWAIALAGNLLTGAVERTIVNRNHNPLDNWSMADVTKAVVSATTSAGVGTVAANSPRWAAVGSRHPTSAVFSGGFVANGTGSLVNDLWVDRRRLSLATVRDGLLDGSTGGASTMAGRSLLQRLPDRAPPGLGSGASHPSAMAPSRLLVVRRPALWVPRSAMAREALVSVPMDGAVQGVAAALQSPPQRSSAQPHLPAVGPYRWPPAPP